MTWPTIFELDSGESIDIKLGDETFTIALHSVRHFWEPDYWIKNNTAHRTIKSADVAVSVNGEKLTLQHRPYEMPVTIGALKLYVETTRLWATECAIVPIADVKKDVRFSAQLADRLWGPVALRFPILTYRWRAASYNNTWSSLVPYNLLYYHRGDDFGAIPDHLEVVAILDGTVTTTPGSTAKGSNVVSIAGDEQADKHTLSVRYAHMNIETIDPLLQPGTHVKAGQVIGKTGCTWEGWHSQWADPHLHISFQLDGVTISPYPFLVEAYLRDYSDSLMAVAGGYHFTDLESPVVLDGTRTVVRDSSEQVHYTWHLHTGEICQGSIAHIRYLLPGQYAEELVVQTSSGYEDRDYAHVRVYEKKQTHQDELAYGWVYAYPVRGIAPGTSVLFWNRLLHMHKPVLVDFGDSTPKAEIDEETTHTYAQPGIFTVSLYGQGMDAAAVMAKIQVVVG
jgi:murein DD-endopeptidase MepM/ murein hydrolase activator NlpD/plastocyanin